MDKLKTGVIGTGVMGRNHIRNLSEEENYFELTGIYDTDTELARQVAGKYGTTAYDSVDRLMEDTEAVVIAVPSSLHYEMGIRAAGYGNHALIEKPLAVREKEAEILIETYENSHLKLAVGHIERFNPVIRELKKILYQKKVFFLEAHRFGPYSGNGRVKDVSVIEDLMIHDIDLAAYLLEGSIRHISGSGSVVKSGKIDFATCMLQFDTGGVAVLGASRVSQNKERYIQIHTEDSFINADLLARTITISKETRLELHNGQDDSYMQDSLTARIFVPFKEPLKEELLSFYRAVKENGEIEADSRSGLNAVRVCEKVAGQCR